MTVNKSIFVGILLVFSCFANADCLSNCEAKYEKCVSENGKNCNITLDNCAAGCKKID